MSTSVVSAKGPSLLLPLGVSIVGHLGAIALVFALQLMIERNRTPIRDVRPVEISLQLKPHTDRQMVQKATKAPTPRGTAEPVPKPTPNTPPPKVSEMKIVTPDAPTQRGVDHSKDRDALLRQLMLREAVEDAAEGSENQAAADPNSTSTESYNASAAGTAGDPELARYEAKIQALFRDNFSPLPTLRDMDCVLSVKTDPSSGRITQSWISKSSGSASYDGACERAALAVATIPLPPPQFTARYANGYNLRLKPKN